MMTGKLEDVNEHPLTNPIELRERSPDEQANYWRERWIATFGKLCWLKRWAKHQGCSPEDLKGRLTRELERLTAGEDL